MLSCRSTKGDNDDAQASFNHAYKALLHGDLKQAQDEAHRESQRFQANLRWSWKFRTLEARAELQQGFYESAIKVLKSAPLPADQPDIVVPVLTIEGEANVETHNFSEAERLLAQATDLCAISQLPSCGYVLKARGLLAAEQNQLESARQLYELTLVFSRTQSDGLLEAYALTNLGYESLAQGHYDEAIDRSEAAYQAARLAGARRLELISQGNIAWSYYKLGDYEQALKLAQDANELATQLGDVWTQESELTNLGDVYMDEGQFERASKLFQRSLDLARKTGAKEDIYGNLRVMARLALQADDLASAKRYAQEAVDMARQDKNHLNELYPTLVQGQIAARGGDTAAAEKAFQMVETDPICPVFLKWEAERSLALLYEGETLIDSANREYQTALATFETARDAVRHEDSQLAFLTNAARLYDDYVHFLVAHGKTDEGLRWADYSRARTLAEGLGVLRKGRSAGPPPLEPRLVAKSAGGTILFYWLGAKQSYLWVITPRETELFELPPGAAINGAAERYRKALTEPGDVLASADDDGQWLYRTLIVPAQGLLKPNTKIFVIPDSSLNNVNFETLLVPADGSVPQNAASKPKLHYWIEDVTIANASSLRVLGAARAGENRAKTKNDRSLLLLGNSIAPNSTYYELPKAAAQMDSVARHFPAAEERILTREQATPGAYLGGHPERYSYIHFVAHGTASRLSPLDSAIVLSKAGIDNGGASDTNGGDSFKLYARDIVQHPLRAELVTISACYSAGERAYSGEGLVGLSWAFLRAGSHNVVAALWEATDSSTEKLMDHFYAELDKGAAPDAALRTAKLSLLRDPLFHKAFYWAPFQLYTGSRNVAGEAAR